MTYINTFKKRLNETVEPEDNFNLVDDQQDDFPIGGHDDDDELEEISTSGGAGNYETPFAFSKGDEDNRGTEEAERLGFKKVKSSKNSIKKESLFMKLSSEMFLNEISYNEYKKDPIASPKHKINQSINYINKGLREIEKAVNHNVRLKQEAGVDNSQYWKSSRENLLKISERLVRVSKQLKELAS